MSEEWDGRKVLMECGDWALVTPRMKHTTNLKSLPIHKPCDSGCDVTNREGHHKPNCGKCGASVPDEIEAAYILHNWELRERG